jgi:hypothetical protein
VARRRLSPRLVLVAGLVMLAAGLGAGLAVALDSSKGVGSDDETQAEAVLNLHPVAGSFRPNSTKLSSCAGDRRCLEQGFGNLAYDEGPKKALSVFRARMASDPAVEAGCHRIAHIIGSASLARFRGNVQEAFALGDSTCWSGYYHGILERSFQGVRTESGFTKIAQRVCSSTELRKNLWLTYQCVHGLGHGLMIQSGYSLPFSLKICERLASEWDRSSCTGGVFMENIAAGKTSAYGVKSPWLRDDDLVYPCDSKIVRGRELYCYLMVTSRVLEANGYDFKGAARICTGVDPAWRPTCFQSYGRDADGFTRQDPVRVRELCDLAGDWKRDCVFGAARDMTSNYANGRRASVLCSGVDKALRAICFNGIGTILGTIRTDTPGRRQLCVEITREALAYRNDCLRGAGAPA